MWNTIFDGIMWVSIAAVGGGLAWCYGWRKNTEEEKRKKIDVSMSVVMLFLMSLFFFSFFMAIREIKINELGM